MTLIGENPTEIPGGSFLRGSKTPRKSYRDQVRNPTRRENGMQKSAITSTEKGIQTRMPAFSSIRRMNRATLDLGRNIYDVPAVTVSLTF